MTTTTNSHPPVRRAASALEHRLGLAAGVYAGLGLLAGLFYRTLTHSRDFTGATTLSLGHTHFLALGMLVMLLVLVLERLFGLSESKAFRWFEPLYHVGLLVTAGALIVRGTLQVVATNPTSMAFAGVAGLGHILLTVAFVMLFLALRGALRSAR
ncbi:DUF2871 domain-containing protein [Propioniciclava sp. MC1595]|uniref:DUF2871 family protein n=1 Tax=Propioniciclava sp. MC1595 TaxID=2760308 RepID=UPI0016626790|nr:DUF2871 family protein [Propioniciclava sp. MC1595]MBB1495372.1 DUF2871 domain-containing protein [Propioniciclava sp. MC1595]QTE24679.1 DUF2871 domain-containing protein [Propioniciclava sp. MC1595]